MQVDVAKLWQEMAVLKRGVAIQRHVFLTVFQLRSLTQASSGGDSDAGKGAGNPE